MFAYFVRIDVEIYVVLATNRDAQLEGINGIKAQAITKQWCSTLDIVRRDVLEIQDLDNQFFQISFSITHRQARYSAICGAALGSTVVMPSSGILPL